MNVLDCKKKNKIKISIIIPLYNKETCILRTIESVTGQDYDNYEVVVVDDGSTDNSVTLVESLNNEHIKIFKKQNGGPSSARNYGVKHASGDWIIFLDADDTLEPGALSLFATLAEKHPRCKFFCGNHYVQRDGKKQLFSTLFCDGYVCNNFFAYHTRRIRARAGAALIARSVALKYPYNEKYRRYEDADSIFDIMRNERCYVTARPVMTYNCDLGEASAPRKNIDEDFLAHITYKGKGCWEQLALYYLYLQGLQSYPGQMERLYDAKAMNTLTIKICTRIIVLLEKMGYIKY